MFVPRTSLAVLARWTLFFLLSLSLHHPVTASLPRPDLSSSRFHHAPSPNNNTSPLKLVRPRAGNFYLRIMPLGASITYGQMSTDGNGYRKALRDQLRYDGWNVNMVGSNSGGTMNDRDVEGFPGYRVDQVDVRAHTVATLYKPNVILINAGTNDATQDYYVSSTGDRMRIMINYLFSAIPGVSIVLSTLIPNTLNQANVDRINVQYRALANDLIAAGRHLVLVDFADGYMSAAADLADTTHPNDGGYRKMAAKWHQAIQRLETNNWLSAPSTDVAFSDAGGGGTTCEKLIGSGNQDPRGRTQVLRALSPRIIDDGGYKHSSQAMGKIHEGFYSGNDTVWFAQLVSKGADTRETGARDDWVFSQGDGAIYYRENLGNGTLGDKTLIPSLGGSKVPVCKQRGIRWGDVDNDGLDDFICIGPEGNMYVAINDGGKPPVFRYVGLYKSVPTTGDYAQTNVRLGDVDGDGRLDYCVVAANGDIYCWRNGGVGEKPAYWQDLGQGRPVFAGKGMGNIDGVRLVDINGDSRADWLWVDDTGKVTTYINQRGAGKGMVPYWDEAGVTHGGMGVAGARSQIRFARIYGSGRADYVYIKCLTVNNTRCDYEVDVWRNTGSGGAHQKGDGVYWCDMSGTGNDDYVFIDHKSKITIFRNINEPPNTDYSRWIDKGVVLDLGGTNRKAIHLGDWNGDGFCDVIITDKVTGALDVYYTNWDRASDTFSFSARTRVVGSGCTQGWGVGLYDRGMRFADIDGDKRVDYMCLEPDGRVTGWLNKPGGLQWLNQIKFSVDKDRANHRWADVNGDGREDFLWIDKFSGNTDVWNNMGARQISGSSWWWDPKGAEYLGSSSGLNLHFPNLGGQGRADMTEVNPKTGLGWTWFNSCPPGGDDGAISDPGLPIPPGGSGGGPGGGGGPIPGDGSDWGGGGGGSGIYYVDSDVWGKNSPTIGCIAPCTYLFPPLVLGRPMDVRWPPYETGILQKSGSTYTTTKIIITVPPFPVSEIPWWPVTVKPGDPSHAIINPVPSVTPPRSSITLRSDQAPISIYPVTGPGGKITYRPREPTSWGGVWPIQPQPTIPIPFGPAPTTTTTSSGAVPPPIITPWSRKPSHTGGKETGGKKTCTANCGSRNCGLFGCGGGCGLFGCGGGCGLFGCNSGGCGLLGCGGGTWGNNGCGPAGCGCGYGCAKGGEDGMGGGGPCNGPTCPNDPEECSGDGCECQATKTAKSCNVLCTETLSYTRTITGTCSSLGCATTSCGRDTTSTRTTLTTAPIRITLTQVAVDTPFQENWGATYLPEVWTSVNAWLDAEERWSTGDGGTTKTTAPTTTTTTKPDPGPSPVPLTRGPIKCHNEADFPGHADIQPDDQDQFSQEFSALRMQFPGNDDTIGPGDQLVVNLHKTDSHGVNYDFRCEWVPGCRTTVDKQSFGFPLGEAQSLITAYLLAREDFTKCSNGGVGGSCQVGCLRYTFTGGLGDPPSDVCDSYDCRGCGTLFDPPECRTCCGFMSKVFSRPPPPTGNITTEEQSVALNGSFFVPLGKVGSGGQSGPVVVDVMS